MHITIEKCEGHICIKDKNGNELSKWKNESVDFFGGFDKVLDRAKKMFPNVELTVIEEIAPPSEPV